MRPRTGAVPRKAKPPGRPTPAKPPKILPPESFQESADAITPRPTRKPPPPSRGWTGASRPSKGRERGAREGPPPALDLELALRFVSGADRIANALRQGLGVAGPQAPGLHGRQETQSDRPPPREQA